MSLLPPLTTIPAHLQTLADYEQQASQHLEEATWHYLQGGAMHELSVQDNQLQFQNVRLIPRHLNDFSQGNTQLNLFGMDYPHPIFLAPIGHQALFHPQAEQATALASELMQSNFVLSTLSNTHMEALNKENPYKWFQLYWQANREKSLALIRLAEQHNYKAIVITIDAPHTGIRDRERKTFFQLPNKMPHPHASVNLKIGNLAANEHPIFQGLMKMAPKWEDIEWLIRNTKLPVILKGVLHPADAKKAVEYGVSGLIVSNHGGRVLDTTIPPLIALQKIRAVVPANYPLLLDGGIRRGSDVFKAIALGASAVLIGRPYIYGLATAGALGVAHVLKILKEEFEITMALMGTATLKEINHDFIDQ
ncbi:alpha-hydroxy-acid oxidizing protein [Acinetobacter sp. C26M]|uniref:alpha-hydroxy acid oxidase n=1 Tax=unclassified Acinetobacter TaxID=196816 RepID=UPI0020366ECF|nr:MULTISPECIES: alpha-hydroxy acid oxidase [unclassified Acinetobacter]USA47007.1 alpha-hydroxy-acid oxidizing protein [Acinetobacter sp. C26M]USA50488.1 alpha-hydroxy-acid oxidizing protein [Acinetobacter sp. C26G]